MNSMREFPCGPVVGTLCFLTKEGMRFDPCSVGELRSLKLKGGVGEKKEHELLILNFQLERMLGCVKFSA